MKKTEDRESGTALFRALDLLETIARSGRSLALPDLEATLDLPKPTVHRLCQRLENEGYLMREPGGRRYTVGRRLLRLGFDVMRAGATFDRHAILESLVNQIGETCNFTALAGHEVVYLDRVEARWPLRLHLEPGSRVPLHCTASGKLFLSAMPVARRRRLLEALDLSALTPNTLTKRHDFETEFAAIRQQGYSLDREEFLLGLIAIAVPVIDRKGVTLAAIACHAPSARLSLDQAKGHLPLLQDAARRMAATLP
jgi:DNA-binding IclR family transcriptional regulator